MQYQSLLILLIALTIARGYTPSPPLSRKKFLASAAASATLAVAPLPSLAFPNKLDNKYDDRPRQRGSNPKDLGCIKRKNDLGDEYMGLKPCKASPNCFCSSTPSDEDDPLVPLPIPSWTAPPGGSMEDVISIINTYEVGQGGIDGGGFKVVTSTPQYVYVQFESYKNGYIDDFEVAQRPNTSIFDVRSSSRIGYLDYGVNAKRINYIASRLKSEKKWSAPGVDLQKFQNYAILNSLS